MLYTIVDKAVHISSGLMRSASIKAEWKRHHGAAQAGDFLLDYTVLDSQPVKRGRLKRRWRDMNRPPLAAENLALARSGHSRYVP